MIVLGLTGSIGMGKSTVAKMFAARGAAVHEADATVHRLYSGPGASLIEAEFPGTVKDGAVDRPALARAVLGDPAALRRLERIVHPLVREEERRFLRETEAAGIPVAVLDIPLLLENPRPDHFDAVIVVSAPPDVQRERVLGRPGMTEENFDRILARQMPDPEKRARADHVISTGGSLEETQAAVDDVLARFAGRPGNVTWYREPARGDDA